MRAYITYFGYFGWLALLAYIQNRTSRLVTRQENVNGHTVTRYNWLFALLIAAPLVYLAAKRGNIGDTWNYRNSFKNSAASLSALPSYLSSVVKDKAFYLFTAICRIFLGYRPVVYFGVIASFQILCIVKTLRKYTPYLLTSFFVFFASTDYLSYMQNGIRQFVAVCIIFLFSRWIFERKYILATVVVLIASQFHQSALLMIPIIFIVQDEPWNKRTVLFLFIALLSVFFVNQFTDILENMLSETQYSNVVSDWTSWEDDGTNPLRVLVYCVPSLLSLLGLRYIREADDPVINICVNMSVITAGLYLISMVTSGIFIGRLPIYTSLFSNCILLPWEVDNFFSRSSSSIIKVIMILLFLLFYFYQIHFVWSAI